MECKNRKTCDEFFRRGTAACAKCRLTGKQDMDEAGGGEETHTDDYGDHGARLYEVRVRLRRTSELDKTYTVAADDEDGARTIAEELAWGEDDSEWEAFDDDADMDVEEVEDNDE